MKDSLMLGTDRAVEKYLNLKDKTYMTLQEAQSLSRELAMRFRSHSAKPDCVVGIANGALLAASVVADTLKLPLHMVLVRRRGSRIKQRMGAVVRWLGVPPQLITARPLLPLWRVFQRKTSTLDMKTDDFQIDVRGKCVALVDDCMESGASIKVARDRLMAAGASQVVTGVLCWYRGVGDSGTFEPDLYLHSFAHFYPWSESSMYYEQYMQWLSANDLALRG